MRGLDIEAYEEKLKKLDISLERVIEERSHSIFLCSTEQ